MTMRGRLAAFVATAVGGLALSSGSALAATINVDLTADNFTNDELCTLREAVTSANSNSPVNGVSALDADCEVGEQAQTDVIALGSNTYTLQIPGSGNDTNQTGDLDLNVNASAGNVQVQGTGSSATEIDGADLDRVIEVIAGPGTATLANLHLDNGTAPSGEPGGAIRNSGTNSLTLSGVSVTNSISPSGGGGIFFSNSSGTLTVTNSTVSGNVVSFSSGSGLIGGGIKSTAGTVILNGATITSNTVTKTGAGIGAGVEGGGMAVQNGTVTIDDSTISNNTLNVSGNALDFPSGGGVSLTNATTSLTDSTISGNSVLGGLSRNGGGIYYTDPDNTPNNVATIQNSTFSGNTAVGSGSQGGAIRIFGGVITLTNGTVTGNSAESGDGIHSVAPGTQTGFSLSIRGTIFNEGSAACTSAGGAAPTSAGHNIDAGLSCGLAGTGDQQSTSVSLGSLGNNGGPTQTHVLNSGSNGIDDIPVAECDEADSDPLTADQRGVPRPQGAACDVGAYERGPECNTLASTIVGTGSGETINGTSGSDVIVAVGGADTVIAGDGPDVVCGGDGDDTIRTGTGGDADVAFGGDSSTDTGTDTISFSDLTAGLTSATLASSVGSTSGTDSGIDSLSGFENFVGSDFADGTSTPVNGNSGANILDGGLGNDTLQGVGGNGVDTLNGGGNSGGVGDTATYINSGTLNPITASLTTNAGTGEGADPDTFVGIESLTGGSGTDTLTGDGGPNTLNGFSADDVLDGRGGNDSFTGGPNNAAGDTVTFAGGAEAVTAMLGPVLGTISATGQGTDSGNSIENLTGSPAGDILTGDAGSNSLSGGNGNDTLADGVTTIANADSYSGGDGSDTVSYAARTSSSANVIVNLMPSADNGGEAGENDDVGGDIENATGGAGQDSLVGDGNANALFGGDNDDTLNGREAADALAGQAGFDAARYLDLPGPVTVNLTTGLVSGAQGDDSLSLVENLVGSPDGDSLIGDGTGNALFGGNGDDTLDGRGSQDILDGGDDSDTASYAGLPSGVQATLTAGALSATGGQGNDSGTLLENLTGSDAADTLTGDDSANVINGGLGADIVFANAGPDALLIRDGVGDTADCGSDADTDTVETDQQGTDTLTNCGSDTIQFPSAPPPPGGGGPISPPAPQGTCAGRTLTLTGSEGNDTITGTAAADVIAALGGNDSVRGLAGNDVVCGGTGNDRLIGGAGNDSLLGEAGKDTLKGSAGRDNCSGAGGRDTAATCERRRSVP
jgi:Ca2+-binding RTX toxin-like protein